MTTIENAKTSTTGEDREPSVDVRWPRDGVAQLTLVGEHDLATASEFEGAAQAVIPLSSGIVLDLRQAQFIDSSIIEAALRTKGRAEAEGVRFNLLVAESSIVLRVLEIANVLSLLNHVESIEEALEPRLGHRAAAGSGSGAEVAHGNG